MRNSFGCQVSGTPTQVDPDSIQERMLVGLISDTHGVLCPEVEQRFQGVSVILHAGDVGHHGGHEEVIARLRRIAPVFAVRGNVDDCASSPRGCAGGTGAGTFKPQTRDKKPNEDVESEQAEGCAEEVNDLPDYRLLELAGWRIMVTHIVGQPPQTVDPAADELLIRHRPDIVVFGHSHKHLALEADGRYWYNPGSAGPARFKLPRTAALLELPKRVTGSANISQEARPKFTLLLLASKAPRRLCGSKKPVAAGKAVASTTASSAAAAVAASIPDVKAKPLPCRDSVGASPAHLPPEDTRHDWSKVEHRVAGTDCPIEMEAVDTDEKEERMHARGTGKPTRGRRRAGKVLEDATRRSARLAGVTGSPVRGRRQGRVTQQVAVAAESGRVGMEMNVGLGGVKEGKRRRRT